MSEPSHKSKHSTTGKIRLSSQPTTGGIEDSGSYPGKSGSVELLRLYDTPRKINVERFYEIMETGNLELLIENPEKLKRSEKLNQTLNDVWLDLQEFYYSNTNEQSFRNFKGKFKNLILIQNDITACYAGLKLIELGDESGYEILRSFGVTSTDEKDIKSSILRKETKFELAKNKMDKGDKKEAVSFYKVVASVERGLNRQLNLAEINLERWVAYLSELREKNEAEKKELQKRKSKRK